MPEESIAVIGAGYVGVVTAAGFARLGHTVALHDIDEWKLHALREGTAPFFEPGLDPLLRQQTRAGRLSFHSSLPDAVRSSGMVLVAVGTPPRADGSCDTTAVETALLGSAQHLRQGGVVVIKSTVPVGTADRLSHELAWRGRKPLPPVVSNPEFLREGSAIDDFMGPDRIIVGARDEAAARRVADLYSPLACPVVITDTSSAEMIKYAANAFLATRISFINEVAGMCEALGADVLSVAEGVGLDHRIGREFLSAGIGFGGSCFPKDLAALRSLAQHHGLDHDVLSSVLAVNRRLPRRVVESLRGALGDLEGASVGVLGLAFKPNTDDCRESPALAVVDELRRAGAGVTAYDPAAMRWAEVHRPSLTCSPTPYEAARGADALVVATEWECFRDLDFARIRDGMRTPVVVDGRNWLDGPSLRRHGFTYLGVGRGGGTREALPAEESRSVA